MERWEREESRTKALKIHASKIILFLDLKKVRLKEFKSDFRIDWSKFIKNNLPAYHSIFLYYNKAFQTTKNIIKRKPDVFVERFCWAEITSNFLLNKLKWIMLFQ